MKHPSSRFASVLIQGSWLCSHDALHRWLLLITLVDHPFVSGSHPTYSSSESFGCQSILGEHFEILPGALPFDHLGIRSSSGSSKTLGFLPLNPFEMDWEPLNLIRLFSLVRWTTVLVFFETSDSIVQIYWSCFVLFLVKRYNLINWRCLVRFFRYDYRRWQGLALWVLDFDFQLVLKEGMGLNHLRLCMFDWWLHVLGAGVVVSGSFDSSPNMNFIWHALSFVLSEHGGLQSAFIILIQLISFSSFMNSEATKPNSCFSVLLTWFSDSLRFYQRFTISKRFWITAALVWSFFPLCNCSSGFHRSCSHNSPPNPYDQTMSKSSAPLPVSSHAMSSALPSDSDPSSWNGFYTTANWSISCSWSDSFTVFHYFSPIFQDLCLSFCLFELCLISLYLCSALLVLVSHYLVTVSSCLIHRRDQRYRNQWHWLGLGLCFDVEDWHLQGWDEGLPLKIHFEHLCFICLRTGSGYSFEDSLLSKRVSLSGLRVFYDLVILKIYSHFVLFAVASWLDAALIFAWATDWFTCDRLGFSSDSSKDHYLAQIFLVVQAVYSICVVHSIDVFALYVFASISENRKDCSSSFPQIINVWNFESVMLRSSHLLVKFHLSFSAQVQIWLLAMICVSKHPEPSLIYLLDQVMVIQLSFCWVSSVVKCCDRISISQNVSGLPQYSFLNWMKWYLELRWPLLGKHPEVIQNHLFRWRRFTMGLGFPAFGLHVCCNFPSLIWLKLDLLDSLVV